MLFLKLRIGEESYVLATRHIIEVLPLVSLRGVPVSTRGIAGLLNYRGRPVPVIDLSELTIGRPAPRFISTRLILVQYGSHRLGLIAEGATEAIQCEASEFADPGIASEASPYLGQIVQYADRLIQEIEVDKLLSAEVGSVLFREAEEPSWSLRESQPS